MRKLKQIVMACALLLATGQAWAQTNLIAGWDGGNDTSSPSNFGWTSSANRTLNARNASSGIRMTTNYSGYKSENGSSYSYSASSDPSSVIFWVRYNSSGESFTYTFDGLEPDCFYDFSALIGWHNNSSNPTFTVKINDGSSDLATMQKAITTKQTLYSVSTRFKTPSTIANNTNIKIVFTCNQTGDCMEAISALNLVNVVIKDELQAAIAYATRVNDKLNTLTSAIATAQGVYDNASATQSQINEAASTLNTTVVSALASAAHKDMSFVIENPGFEFCTAITANQGTNSSQDYASAGWTVLSTSTSNSCGAVVEYGSSYTINGVTPPSADNLEESGNALGISVGWNTTVAYQSSPVCLPAGTYTMTVYGYNNNPSGSNFTSKNGFITSSNNYLSSKSSFTNGTWETDVITFTLTEPTTGVFQIGGTAGNNTSTSHAKVFFDNITLAYESPLAVAIAAWNTVHNTLESLNAKLLTDAAETAITTELAKERPGTKEKIESATAALQALIDSYDGIKAAYDSYKALKAQIEDLKNTSKYTFAGDDALSTFNSTLSDIDTSAEDATEAATLTALLPDLKTAGNTFVGDIESNDGFDLTYNIENNSFETGALSPWTTTGSNDTGVKPNSNGTYTTTGVDGDYLFNTWNNGAGSKVSQTLSNLPQGYYTVTALVASDAGNTINILAGASTKGIASDATDGKEKFVEGTTDKVLVSDGSLEIGTNSSTWYKSDNFRLTYYTVKAGAAEAWATAKAAAEAARDDAAYTNVTGSEKTTLLAEIAKEEPTTAEAYGTATTALQEATSAFTAAKDSYDALIDMRIVGGTYTTEDWPRASAAKKTALDNAIVAEPTDAADAVTKTNAIVTAYRQFVESNGLAEGIDVAVDYTNTYLADADPDVNTGWTDGIGTDNRSNEVYTKGDGTQSGRYYDGGWSTSAAVNINMTRDLTLPEGQYQLQITARGSANLTSYTMSIGGETVNLPIEGSDAAVGTFGHGWSDKYVVFESDGTNPLTLAITATSEEYQQWISFNRLRLIKLDAILADDTDYENLNEAIASAENKKLGFEDGEYAPYNNVEVLTTLAIAKAIDPNVNNVQSYVQEITDALSNDANWTANDGDVDAIYNGLYATVAEGKNYPDGWTRTNAWGQMMSGLEGDYATAYYNQPGSLKYGDTGLYTMPLAANTMYKLTFAYRSHENNSNNGVTVSVLNGEDGLAATTFAKNGSTTEWKTATQYFTTGAAGNYVLTLANSGNTWMTGVSLTKAVIENITIDETKEFIPTDDYANVTLTRTIKAGVNTLVLPFDMTQAEVEDKFGTGSKVYEVQKFENDNISFVTADGITANKPCLLKATEAGSEYTIDERITKTGTPVANGTGVSMIGTYTKMNAPEGSYIISGDKIYQVNSTVELKSTRAYINITTPQAGARVLSMSFDDGTSGIATLTNGELKVETGDLYDLTGRKVNNPTKKGLYIINGKKVVK